MFSRHAMNSGAKIFLTDLTPALMLTDGLHLNSIPGVGQGDPKGLGHSFLD